MLYEETPKVTESSDAVSLFKQDNGNLHKKKELRQQDVQDSYNGITRVVQQ